MSRICHIVPPFLLERLAEAMPERSTTYRRMLDVDAALRAGRPGPEPAQTVILRKMQGETEQ